MANIAMNWLKNAATECTNMMLAVLMLLRWKRQGGEIHP